MSSPNADRPDEPSSRPKAFTPPKGRPTRSRDHPPVRRGLFGPVAQWTAAALLLLAVVALIIMWTDGGDFNPFDDDGAAVSGVEAVAVRAGR